MPVFHCAHCEQPIDADETLSGVEVGCPGCRALIQVPSFSPYQPYQPPSYLQGANTRPQSEDHRSSTPDKWRILAPVIGTAVALVLCLLKKLSEPISSLDAAMGNTGAPRYLGGAVGYTIAAGIFALVIALIIAGIAKACQKSFKTMLARCYGIGVVLCSLLMLAGGSQRPHSAPAPAPQANKKTREELNKLEEDIKKMQAGVPADDASSPKTQAPLASEADDTAKIVLISRQYFEEVAALQKSYMTEIGKMGFMRLLDVGRLMADKDKDFSESYAMLVGAKLLVKEYGAKMREAMASLPAKIRASNLDSRSRESHAQSAELGTQTALITFDENWALEASCMDHFTTIIDLLSTRRDHWQVVNNKILFTEASDVESYNAAMGKLNDVVARQNEIKKAGVQNTGKTFDDLRSALPK